MVRKTNCVAVVLTAVFFFLITSTSFAADQPKTDAKQFNESGFPVKAINNLIVGIQSDNEGLKKSSIYYAGIYELKEMVEPLIELLNKEKDTDMRVLIALTLYKIGNKDGLKAIVDLVAKNVF